MTLIKMIIEDGKAFEVIAGYAFFVIILAAVYVALSLLTRR